MLLGKLAAEGNRLKGLAEDSGPPIANFDERVQEVEEVIRSMQYLQFSAGSGFLDETVGEDLQSHEGVCLPPPPYLEINRSKRHSNPKILSTYV